MYLPTASNETFQDILESAMTGRADFSPDPSEDEGFDHAGTWGPVGGVGGFILLLASAVAVAHKYWGAFETLSRSLTNLLDAAAAFVRGRTNPPPSEPAPEVPMENLSDDDRVRENARRIAHSARDHHLSAQPDRTYVNQSWI